MYCPTEPTIKEEEVDPFSFASMSQILKTITHDPYYIGSQPSVSYPSSTAIIMRSENHSPIAVKPTALNIFSVNKPQVKTLDEINYQIHFRASSDTSRCVCRCISFPCSGSQVSLATMMDLPDKLLYQATAQVFNEEHTEQKIVTIWPDQLSDESFIHLLCNYQTKK